MLILQGGEALSSFRIQSLINRAQAIGIHIEDLICTFLFFVMGDARDADKLAKMLDANPLNVRIRFGRVTPDRYDIALEFKKRLKLPKTVVSVRSIVSNGACM